MKIAISGATGFIGMHLSRYLRDRGHDVVPLGREYFSDMDRPVRRDETSGTVVVGDAGVWNGAMGRLVAALEGCGAVVNLAGAPINRRWSDAYKEELYASRIGTTRRLVDAINALETKPAVLVSASAVGYYPSGGCYTETEAVKGTGFLSDLCAAWEAEAEQVAPQVRLVLARFGVVFSPDGGAFPQMARPFRLGVATRLGDGRQDVSWIDLEDLVRAIEFVIEDDRLHGAVNMTAPQQLTNAELTRELAVHYHTPFRLAVPGWLVRAAYGEASGVMLAGQCAVPEKLTSAGFMFGSGSVGRFLGRLRPGDAGMDARTGKDGNKLNRFFLIGIVMAICFCSCGGHSVQVAEMEEFDISRYLGTWYEIARLDHHFERGLEQVTAHYALRDDGRVAVVNRGFDPASGRWKEATAKAVQTRVKNYLKVYFVPFIAGKYRIAYLNADYTLAVVSGGTLEYLWLLARTPEVAPADRDRMLEEARMLGYDVSKLIFPRPATAAAAATAAEQP